MALCQVAQFVAAAKRHVEVFSHIGWKVSALVSASPMFEQPERPFREKICSGVCYKSLFCILLY
jgi:hypothetical protein